MATGQIFTGMAVIRVYNNQTIDNPTERKQIAIDLSKIEVTWESTGNLPPLNNTKTLNFALPSGFTSNYIYSYDLHGHTSGVTNGQLPQLMSYIYPTNQDASPSGPENLLNSSIPINYNGTDWWYGPLPDTDHPLFLIGSSSSPPSRIVFNCANTSQITQATWNIYISVGLASNIGGGNGPHDGGISWEIRTIAIIVIVIIVLIIIIYFWYSYSSSTPQNHPTYNHYNSGYPIHDYSNRMSSAVT